MNYIDFGSLKLCGITVLGGMLINIFPSGTIGFLTGLAAFTTIVYNVVKFLKEFKKH